MASSVVPYRTSTPFLLMIVPLVACGIGGKDASHEGREPDDCAGSPDCDVDADADTDADTDSDADLDFGPFRCEPVETEPVGGGRTIWVSPAGNDRNDGSSEGQAVQTIAAAQALAGAGDVIWLEPGAVFAESVYVGPGWGDVGRAGAPVVFSSSASNPATIRAGREEYGFFIYNAGHVVVENLIVAGPGMSQTTVQGVAAMTDDGRFEGITFRNLDVSGFNEGIVVWSWEDDGDGFDDVLIEQVYLHENLQGGGSFYGAGTASHRDVVVRCSEFAYNPGDPSVDRPSGDGFVFGSVTDGLIDGCTAHHNGGDGTNSAGPVGLWAYNSSNITIQFSESWANMAMYQDGDGFDLDVGTTNSVIQYCYSHDNFGAGYLLSQQGTEPWGNNVIRYNISENDATGGRMGALTYYSEESALGLEDSWVYGNTFYSAAGPLLNLTSAPNAARNHLFNNIFVADNGQMLVWDWSGSAPAGAVIAQGNLYWAAGGTPDFQGYASLDAWRAGTGQETLSGAPVGIYADPLLRDPGNGGTLGDATMLVTLDAYRLLAGSPAIDAGLDPALFVSGLPQTDFYGTALPQGVGYDVGANEVR